MEVVGGAEDDAVVVEEVGRWDSAVVAEVCEVATVAEVAEATGEGEGYWCVEVDGGEGGRVVDGEGGVEVEVEGRVKDRRRLVVVRSSGRGKE